MAKQRDVETNDRGAAVKELLSRFPMSPSSRLWHPDDVIEHAFAAADRVFDAVVKDKTKPPTKVAKDA